MQNTISSLIRSNISSGLVVSLVALPLCLGIALASGAPPLAGIISGIIGGIIVGALSDSHISVSGPAAGLTAILVAGIADLGSFELLLFSGIIAGLLQLAFGFLKAGGISNYIPSNVIEGMLAGIGIIIIIKQLPYAFGITEKIEISELSGANLADIIHPGAIIITLCSLIILLFWERIGKNKYLKMIPAPLIAVIFSIGLNGLFKTSFENLYISTDSLVNLPVISNKEELSQLIVFPDFNGFLNPKVWILGITIALVASIETLLCIEAADKMDPQRRITNPNRELKAQGIGNLLSSLIGGLPMTSVVVRSSANARAGATSKISCIIHGIILLICVILIPGLLNKIPLATLSGVLLLVGYKLTRPAVFVHFWHKGRLQFIPFAATIAGVVFTDLLSGVAIGLGFSILFILLGNKKKAYTLQRCQNNRNIHLTLAEEVSFLNKAAIKNRLNKIEPGSKLTIDTSDSSYIASDVIELIEEFVNHRARELNIKIELIGFRTSKKIHNNTDRVSLIVDHSATI
ncbi:MAG: SulP family inorganic anion transporter [Bacteroidales bacterium]